MGNRICFAAAVVGLMLAGGTADAGVPGWAYTSRTNVIPVSSCRQYAVNAVQSVTGSQAIVNRLDAYTYEIRGFTPEAGIFVYCSAGVGSVCGEPQATVSINVFGNMGAAAAGALRDQVSLAYGNPHIIDYC